MILNVYSRLIDYKKKFINPMLVVQNTNEAIVVPLVVDIKGGIHVGMIG